MKNKRKSCVRRQYFEEKWVSDFWDQAPIGSIELKGYNPINVVFNKDEEIESGPFFTGFNKFKSGYSLDESIAAARPYEREELERGWIAAREKYGTPQIARQDRCN